MNHFPIFKTLAGGIAFYMFVWLFPTVYNIQYFIYTTYPDNISLQLQSASTILVLVLYLLFALACLGEACEHIIYYCASVSKKYIYRRGDEL
jgi:uncharacterized membrane protein